MSQSAFDNLVFLMVNKDTSVIAQILGLTWSEPGREEADRGEQERDQLDERGG